MTLRKPTAAIAAIAALVGGLTVAGAADAQTWRGRGGTSFSFGFSTGPAYGYGYGYGYPGYYGPQRAYRGGAYGWNVNRGYYPRGRYYAPPRYNRGGRFRTCDRWVWDGWRQTYVLVRGRC